MKYSGFPLSLLIVIMLLPAACTVSDAQDGGPGKLQVVASTSILGDVIAQIGGEYIQLDVLLPSGTDPHAFIPRAQDLVLLSDADIIFINGFGLEETLDPYLQSLETVPIIEASEGIEGLSLTDDDLQDEHESHAGIDPHVWMDPNNVILWVETIARALSDIDPDHAVHYRSNADAYISELINLDDWIQDQIGVIPPENRKLVSDHRSFGYFAYRYGFEQVGALIPSLSTNASPSAQDLAVLEESIIELAIQVIFVDKNANQKLAERVAEDTGVNVVLLYTGTLSAPGGEADNYLNFMRYNVSEIVNALQ